MSSHHVGKVSCFSEKYKCKFQIIQFHRAKFVPQNIPSPLSSSHSPSNILSVPCWDGTRLYQLNLHSVLLMFELWPSSGFCSWAQFKQEKNGVTHWGFFFFNMIILPSRILSSSLLCWLNGRPFRLCPTSTEEVVSASSLLAWKVLDKGSCASSSAGRLQIH